MTDKDFCHGSTVGMYVDPVPCSGHLVWRTLHIPLEYCNGIDHLPPIDPESEVTVVERAGRRNGSPVGLRSG
jgi:hypothetical protein